MPFPFRQPATRFTGRATVPPPPRWVPGPDDQPPADATQPDPDTCLLCPAAARVVLRRAVVYTPGGWTDTQAVGIIEAHLCGHHATQRETSLHVTGWITVLDVRSRIGADHV